MAKNIKFILSRGEDQIFTREMAEQILNSKEQLIRIMLGGRWTGYTLNKAHIVQTIEVEAAPTAIEGYQLSVSDGLKRCTCPEFQKTAMCEHATPKYLLEIRGGERKDLV